MLKRTTGLGSLLALSAMMVVCVDVGIDPGPAEPCADASPGDLRCHKGNELQTCVQSSGVWTKVLQCEDGEACFDAGLYGGPACMQRFDCYDTTVHYISCDISEMTLTQQDECHIACKDQSLNDDYRPLINCYGKSCKNAVEPYSCVVQDCSNELNTCLAAPNPACVERDCESPPRNLASEPDSDCPTIASCYSACPAHCNEDCGADETCLPGCIVVCQRTCRGTAQVADQLAFLELGACQIARCAHVSGVDSTTCMWTQCTSQAARCVASGDAICWDTVQCLLAAAQSAPGERESAFFGCIETGSSSGVDAASELLSCAESVDVSGQACGAASPGDKWQCIKDNCVEEAAACPEP